MLKATDYVGSLAGETTTPLRDAGDPGAPNEMMVLCLHIIDRAIADSMLTDPRRRGVRNNASAWLHAWSGSNRLRIEIIERGVSRRLQKQAAMQAKVDSHRRPA